MWYVCIYTFNVFVQLLCRVLITYIIIFMYTHHICFLSFQQNGAIASCVIGFVVVVVVIMFYF